MNKHQQRLRHLLGICYALQMIDIRDGRLDPDRTQEAISSLGELGETLCDSLFAPLDDSAILSQSGLDNRGKGRGSQRSPRFSSGGPNEN